MTRQGILGLAFEQVDCGRRDGADRVTERWGLRLCLRGEALISEGCNSYLDAAGAPGGHLRGRHATASHSPAAFDTGPTPLRLYRLVWRLSQPALSCRKSSAARATSSRTSGLTQIAPTSFTSVVPCSRTTRRSNWSSSSAKFKDSSALFRAYAASIPLPHGQLNGEQRINCSFIGRRLPKFPTARQISLRQDSALLTERSAPDSRSCAPAPGIAARLSA